MDENNKTIRAINSLYYLKGIIEATNPSLLIYPGFKIILTVLEECQKREEAIRCTESR